MLPVAQKTSETKPSFQIEAPGPIRWRIIKAIGAITLVARNKVTSSGVEVIPFDGAAISISNHRHDEIDVPLLFWTMRKRRTPFCPAKDEIVKPKPGASHLKKTFKKFQEKMMTGAGALFFDRDTNEGRRQVSQKVKDKLKNGHMVHIFIEETSKNKGQQLGWLVSSPVMLAAELPEEQGVDSIILAGIGGTEHPENKKFHVEFGELSINGLKKIIRRREKTAAGFTAVEISRMIEEVDGFQELSVDRLREVLNPDIKGRREARQRTHKKDPETSKVSRMDIYTIFTEQAVRPALQAKIDIAYEKVAA